MRHLLFIKGMKVQGTYMGEAAFTGTVKEMRTHTIESYMVTYTIDLDPPVKVFGSMRNRLCLDVDVRDGSMSDGDSLQEVQ